MYFSSWPNVHWVNILSILVLATKNVSTSNISQDRKQYNVNQQNSFYILGCSNIFIFIKMYTPKVSPIFKGPVDLSQVLKVKNHIYIYKLNIEAKIDPNIMSFSHSPLF